MLPRDLQPGQFSGYPPQAKSLAVTHIDTLRVLPLNLAPNLLREMIDYDYKFPAERASIDNELAVLSSLSKSDLHTWMHDFDSISISSKLEEVDWVNEPAQFVEQQSAYLWATHQLDAFRKAATEYGVRLQKTIKPKPLPVTRLGIAVIGQGVDSYDGHLFHNLLAHGTRFDHVKPEDGLSLLLAAVEKRAQEAPVQFGHWYVDGGHAATQPAGLTCVSYDGIAPMRAAMLKFMQSEIQTPGMGPEKLRTDMAKITPERLGMKSAGDAVLDRFQLKVLSEGSGTQIFSTTFAQWTTREALRRAEPLTLMTRYASRQRQRPMNELLNNTGKDEQPDALGSLVDADMGAYYHWINQQRLEGFENSVFLVWFEGHPDALVVSPTLPRGATSSSALDLGELLKLALS